MTIKEAWKKFWFLLWKDDSLKGWIFSILFLFIFIKFVFFPVLTVATGTALPLAIVESCSMYHQGNLFSDFDSWWTGHFQKYEQFFINKSDFSGFPFENGFNKGDILFVVKANPNTLKKGDIIIFQTSLQSTPIIHRIVRIEDVNGTRIFSTMGDNNPGQLSVEQNIKESQIIGKAELKLVPYFGWVKLIFYDWQNPPAEQGFCKGY